MHRMRVRSAQTRALGRMRKNDKQKLIYLILIIPAALVFVHLRTLTQGIRDLLGVSEPAAVPRQTSQAEVTPTRGRNDED